MTPNVYLTHYIDDKVYFLHISENSVCIKEGKVICVKIDGYYGEIEITYKVLVEDGQYCIVLDKQSHELFVTPKELAKNLVFEFERDNKNEQ